MMKERKKFKKENKEMGREEMIKDRRQTKEELQRRENKRKSYRRDVKGFKLKEQKGMKERKRLRKGNKEMRRNDHIQERR